MKLLKKLYYIYYEIFIVAVLALMFTSIYVGGKLLMYSLPKSSIVKFFADEKALNYFWSTFFTGLFGIAIALLAICVIASFIFFIITIYNTAYIICKSIQIRKRLYDFNVRNYTKIPDVVNELSLRLSDIVITKNIFIIKKKTPLEEIENFYESRGKLIIFCDSLGNTGYSSSKHFSVEHVFKDLT